MIFAAIFAPFLAPHDPNKIHLIHKLSKPSTDFYLGTDHLGRDIFSRLLYGARISLAVSFASVLGALTIGVFVGAIAGYFGGLIDSILMRVVDVILSIPSLFLLITIVTVFHPGIDKLIMIFAFLSWTTLARLVRGEFLSLRSREFVLANRTLGYSHLRIIFLHMLPNVSGPIIVTATLLSGSIILAEAALSFLGLGVQPPTASWGNMLQGAQNFTIMKKAWWVPLFPGSLILLTVLSLNFLGDGLRDYLDPRV